MPSPSSNRLPITHPDYRYPDSRNPYWEKIRSQSGRVFSDNETEVHRGRWRERFAESAPGRRLHVEIGCNAGHVALEWARANPADAFIGIDWKFKPIFRAAEKAEKRGLQNLIFLRAHAERLPFIFGQAEIDRLYLYFPDPWPRKSQWKNRFVTPESLTALSRLMKPDGIFHIKTDHRGYFDWMESALAQVPHGRWRVLERSTDLHAEHPDPLRLEIPEVTLFEKLFIRDGIPINSLKLGRG